MLRVNSVSKNFGGRNAVDNVSLLLKPGEVTGLLGANGAGKSTTMRIASGVLKPDSGGIEWQGASEQQTAVALAGQSIALYGFMTAQENMLFFGQLVKQKGYSAADNIRAVRQLLDIDDLLDRRVDTLSGGQKRLIHLACTFLLDRPVIIVDEPTAGLDLVGQKALVSALKKLASTGKAICCSSHYTSEIADVADRVVILDRGKVVADDTLAGIVAEAPLLLEIRFSDGSEKSLTLEREADAEEAINQLETGGLAITGYQILRPSLQTAMTRYVSGWGRDEEVPS